MEWYWIVLYVSVCYAGVVLFLWAVRPPESGRIVAGLMVIFAPLAAPFGAIFLVALGAMWCVIDLPGLIGDFFTGETE